MSYKFQSGDATLSGSVTLVNYQDLLFEADGTSNIGAAAKEVGVIYTTRQTASVGISGSAIYANKFYGNGAGITGLSSDRVTVTDKDDNVDYRIVGVSAAGAPATLVTDDDASFTFNPSTLKAQLPGVLDMAGATGSAGSLVKGQIQITGINKAGASGAKGAGVVRLSGSGATYKPAVWGGLSGKLYGGIAFGPARAGGSDLGTEASIEAAQLPGALGGLEVLNMVHQEGYVRLSGSIPDAGVAIDSALQVSENASFEQNVVLGDESGDTITVKGTIAGNSNEVLVSSSMTALNVDSKNSGGNSFLGVGGALLGHSGGGNALIKLQTQGGNGTVSGSENADFGGRLQAAANKFTVNSNGNVAINGPTLSLTASGQIFTDAELHAAKNKFKVTSGGAVTGVSFAASNGNVTADGNVSASVNLLGQRVSVDGNVIAANNISSSAGAVYSKGALEAAANKFTVDSSANVMFKGGLTAAGLGGATVDLTADLMVIDDGAGGTIKTTSLADYATALAGGSNEGLSSTAGRLALDLNDLAAGTVNVAADSFAMKDADDNSTKIFTMASYATAIAGAGITATNGVLSTDAQSVNAIGNANALLAEGTNYLSTSLGADRTYRTPVNPTVGDIIRIKAGSAAQMGSYKMILSASGLHQIDGERLINIQSAYAGVSMVYVSTGQWRIF